MAITMQNSVHFLAQRSSEFFWSPVIHHTYISTYVHLSVTFFISSPDLKAQVSFSERLSIVHMSVNFPHFHLFSTEPLGQFSTKLSTRHSLMVGIQIYSNEGPCPFPRGDNYEIVKIHWQNFKISSRTTWPISTRLGTKHSWVMEIQVCSNERLRPFPWRR